MGSHHGLAIRVTPEINHILGNVFFLNTTLKTSKINFWFFSLLKKLFMWILLVYQPKQAVARMRECVRYARTRSPFSLQPQPTACAPCGTQPTDGFKGRLKKRLRRLLHLPCDKGYLKNSCCWCSGILFQTTCNAWIRCNLPPVGEGWGEGILKMAAIFPNT